MLSNIRGSDAITLPNDRGLFWITILDFLTCTGDADGLLLWGAHANALDGHSQHWKVEDEKDSDLQKMQQDMKKKEKNLEASLPRVSGFLQHSQTVTEVTCPKQATVVLGIVPRQ